LKGVFNPIKPKAAAHDLKAPCNHIGTIAKTIENEETSKKISRLCSYQGFVISSNIEIHFFKITDFLRLDLLGFLIKKN
jgi:hypothetical protein